MNNRQVTPLLYFVFILCLMMISPNISRAAIVNAPPSIAIPTNDLDGRYAVSWGTSATAGVTYILQEASNSTFTTGLRQVYVGIAKSAAITGRSTGTYYYRIRAIKTGNTSSPWMVGKNGCVVSCGLPSSINVPLNDLDGKYSIVWGASSTIGITYVLQEATNSTFTTGLRQVYAGIAKSAAITGRTLGTTYYYRVMAKKTGYQNSLWLKGTNGCEVKVTHAAGMLLKMENFGYFPNNKYQWSSIVLLPVSFAGSDQWWGVNDSMIRSRYAQAKIVAYISGCVINDEQIKDYNEFAQGVNGELWNDSFYLHDQNGKKILFDSNIPNQFYINTGNVTARKYMVNVARGMMKIYAEKTGQQLDGIYVDMIEWKLRQQASPFMPDSSYRSNMLTLFSEIKSSIQAYNLSAEVGGNPGSIRSHQDYTLLDGLDTIFSENTFGQAFSGYSDNTDTILPFINHLIAKNEKKTVILGIDGDYLGWGNYNTKQCPDDIVGTPSRYQKAYDLAKQFPSYILISADYGPQDHGDLDCFDTNYMIW